MKNFRFLDFTTERQKERQGLPLHIKKVSRLSWEKADALVKKKLGDKMFNLWLMLTGPFRKEECKT
jgi:hypothetical protein